MTSPGHASFGSGVKTLLARALARFGYRIQGIRYTPRQLLDPRNVRSLELADAIYRRMFEFGEELSFIQIGAYDGVTGDPLRKYIARHRWRGILVEPQPKSVQKLQELYRDSDRVTVLPVAVDGVRGTRTMFTIESDTAPEWAGGLASFDRNHIVRHATLVPGLEGAIREIVVDCVLIEDVLAQLPSTRVDILQIDVEGADALVLSLFPFEKVRPGIVHWEIKNLTTSAREQCFDRLLRFGYRLAPSGGEDMMAILDQPS